jgi:hypothetical protein
MSRVAIGPTDRFRCFVVAMDIATNLTSQVGDGSKNAARQQVALDLGKPDSTSLSQDEWVGVA